MMDQRRALTIPFNVDKDNLVSWTAFAGCKRRSLGSPQKNGSMLFDRNLVFLEMTRRKPRLILTDVLETDQGKAYMERIKPSCTLGNQAQELSSRRESGRCRDRRSRQRETRKDKNNSVTPKCNQKKTASSSTQRSGFRRRSQNVDDEVDTEESKDIEEVIIGKDNRDDLKFAEVVDCGLSVSWEPAEDTASCDEFPPASIKDRLTDPEKDVHNLKRKRKDAASHCNGTGSPKRHRESVLRLTGEDRRDGGLASTHIRLEESGEDGDLESLDRTIVQFTVGADDRTELLVPVNFPNLVAEDAAGTPRRSLSSSQDNMAPPTEPIVLSSDDEESGGVLQRCKPAANSLVTVGDALIQEQLSEEDVAKQPTTSDIQVMRVVVDLPGLVEDPPILSVDYSFSMLHCGGYQGKANGNIMITDQRIFIPLKDADQQVEVTLTLERKDLQRYSVWEQHDLEDREFYFKGIEEPCPAAVLLLCVSQSAAAAVQRELIKLCVEQDQRRTTDEVSPFILLMLRHPVEGMEGALLRSLLDIDCLNSVAREKSFSGADKVCCFEDFQTPVLSLDDSINLIRRSRLGSHLLCLLDLETSDPTFNTDQDDPHLGADENTTLNMQPEVESQKETELDLKTATELDTGMLLKPEEDQKELDQLPDKTKESTPVYTLCHRRTQGSYFTTLCRPDSSLTKFKHQGLARRLIQFPPPPLKGGITVTMEDLRCLDSGHFLNDVIIDFYLKYLLQNVSAAVAERSHIFSSFFYKQLTRRDNASEGVTSDSCQRQRRHHRVRTWTRHVDIFKKDFLFVPVNQEAHWYLVVICFPGLDEPKSEAWSHPNEEIQEQDVAQGSESPNDNTEKPPTPPTFNHSDSVDTGTEKTKEKHTKDPLPDPVNCTERTFQKKTVSKRPCILIMDSLKLSLHERVFKLLREYLQSEWEVRRGSSRDFGPDQMQSSHCKVPLQDNSSDCGLYLLQYVESFLKDPVVHFDLPLQLQRWFPRQQVRRKRDEIRDLVLNLYRHQNLDSNR